MDTTLPWITFNGFTPHVVVLCAVTCCLLCISALVSGAETSFFSLSHNDVRRFGIEPPVELGGRGHIAGLEKRAAHKDHPLDQRHDVRGLEHGQRQIAARAYLRNGDLSGVFPHLFNDEIHRMTGIGARLRLFAVALPINLLP